VRSAFGGSADARVLANAIAIGTVIATIALEKTGKTLWDKTGQFLVTLKKHSCVKSVANGLATISNKRVITLNNPTFGSA